MLCCCAVRKNECHKANSFCCSINAFKIHCLYKATPTTDVKNEFKRERVIELGTRHSLPQMRLTKVQPVVFKATALTLSRLLLEMH